jgi:Uma2 family endonuclease
MTQLASPVSRVPTLADLLRQLGDVSPNRVLSDPPPGRATEEDLLRLERQGTCRWELVDGVLVEKAMGYRESILALALGEFLRAFVRASNLGLVSGEAGMMRLFPGLVRIPDVAFASWSRLPGNKVPVEPIPDLIPDLAVEVRSEGNTNEEMARKLREYFAAGVRLVWLVNPDSRTIAAHTSPEDFRILHEPQTLDGGTVLPGFELPLTQLFAELDRQGNG